MSSLLLTELSKVQQDYKNKLLLAKELLFSQNINIVLIELMSFWLENKKIAECALNYLAKPYDRFFFTAATILDFDDNEHIPFLAIGKLRIWDDPIFDYAQTMTNTPQKAFNEEMKETIQNIIDDNIKIIDNVDGMIMILPIRLLFSQRDELKNNYESLFLSLFKESPDSIESYFAQFITIDDVANGLKEGIKPHIFLNAGDGELGFKQRFENYVSNNILPISNNKSEGYIFFFAVIGHIIQVMDILSIALGFKIYPYVRSEVTLKYATLLLLCSGEELSLQGELRNVLNIMWTCYVLHNVMPRGDIADNLQSYSEALNQVNFSARLLEKVKDLESNKVFSPNNIEKEIILLINELQEISET